MLKSKMIAIAVTCLLVLLPLGAVWGVGSVINGAALGVAASLKDLPTNCKAPFNIFKAWDTFEDFITGADCTDSCAVSAPVGPDGGGIDNSANRAEYAKIIIGTGIAMKIPEKGIVAAITTTLVESGLKNYANDGIYDTSRNPADGTLSNAEAILAFVKKSNSFPHDAVGSDASSVGLFQQQAWWGTMGASNWENDPENTIKRLMDPIFQSQKFYNALLNVSGWEDMETGVVVQKVQVSATPLAYTPRVGEAQALYNQYKGDAKKVEIYDFGASYKPGGATENKPGGSTSCGGSSSTGIVLDKSSLYQITAQFSQPRGSDLGGAHAGMDIDCGEDFEPVYTPVSGVVLIATPGNPSGYGSPAGDLMVKTEDGTVIQLHHMRGVFPKAGATVKGGEKIGECASTGLSTGTHLHVQAYVTNSTNPKIKALPISSYIPSPETEKFRDPALVLDILGVDICPPYTANRKVSPVGSDVPGWPMKCWPPKEWTR